LIWLVYLIVIFISKLSKRREPISVEPQVFNLLSYFLANSQRLLTRGELVEQVWPGKIICDTTLSGHIKYVRNALDDNGKNQIFIKTIHSRGYQFTAPVTVTENRKPLLKQILKTKENALFSKGPLVTVVPFSNLSSDPEQQFFAEGMSEDIITELSRFSDIHVLASHSAFQLKDTSSATENFREKRNMNYLTRPYC
jgi:DNA-binding winged helix-turn-helix (wHTH) protein